MVIVNVYLEEEHDAMNISLAGVINDTLCLKTDIDLIIECIEGSDYFEPKFAGLYEVHLKRATMSSDLLTKHFFVIDRVITQVYDKETDSWEVPVVRL